MKNRPITVFLNSLGISGTEQQFVARAVLEDEGFTRAGRTNMAVHKERDAEYALEARLALHCANQGCRDTLDEQERHVSEPRVLVLVERDACEVCGGSADRRAVNDMAAAMSGAGLSRAVVVGGTKPKWARMRQITPQSVEWRFVDGLGNSNQRDASSDLRWGDVILIWAGTPAQHRVTNLYSGPRTITVPTTGIAALAREAAKFARGRGERGGSTTG